MYGKCAQYKAVQGEIVEVARAQMSKINRAYHVILSSFSSGEKESLAGFEWIDIVHSEAFGLGGPVIVHDKFKTLPLECGKDLYKHREITLMTNLTRLQHNSLRRTLRLWL
jgi:hypothetical protein